MNVIKPVRTATPWLIILSLLLALVAAPVSADPKLVTVTGKIDDIAGDELVLNDFSLTLTADTQVYGANGKASSADSLRRGMRVEAVIQVPGHTVQIIKILR